jgi:hypothetical protein
VDKVGIIATACSALDLKPGDLFSMDGPEYWDSFGDQGVEGVQVYIRTAAPLASDGSVYRITIEKQETPIVPQEWATTDCTTADEIQEAMWILAHEGIEKVWLENPTLRVRMRHIVVPLRHRPASLAFDMEGGKWSADVLSDNGNLVDKLETDVPADCHDPRVLARAIIQTLNEVDVK